MRIRNFPFRGFYILSILLCSTGALAQQKVDLDKAQQENKGLFSGGYFRGGVGISRATYSYGSVYEGLNLSPLSFHLEYGKRINRNFGTYFGMAVNALIQKNYSLGLSDVLEQWTQTGLHLGGLYYIKGGNSYFAPELGVGFGMIETTVMGDESTLGISGTLKYGYDRHIAGKFFLGVQAFFSYAHGWHQEDTDPATGTTLQSSCLTYGAAFTVKFGQ
jgi:hypothetical protein